MDLFLLDLACTSRKPETLTNIAIYLDILLQPQPNLAVRR
jgi:hypothetical protein